MRAERREALVDFLLEAAADEGTTPFPADVLAGLRRVVPVWAVALPAPRAGEPRGAAPPQPVAGKITARRQNAMAAVRRCGVARFIDGLPSCPCGCLTEIEAPLRAGGNGSIGVFSG